MSRFVRWMAAIVVVVCLAPAGKAQNGFSAKPTDFLERLFKASPAERMKLVGNFVKGDGSFVKAERGPISLTVLERGQLKAANSTDIVVSAKRSAKGSVKGLPPYFVIKWVIDEGATVKKGQKLIELDDAPLRKILQTQKTQIAQAAAELQKAVTALERVRRENGIDVKLAQIDLRLAELESRKYKGDDPIQKQLLDLNVERANLLVERARSSAEIKEEPANAERQRRKAEHDRELATLADLVAEHQNYVLSSPRDGVVIYHVPEQNRFAGGPGGGLGRPGGLIAQGERVQEKQKLMSICDLRKMDLVARIPEASIAKIRVGQTAAVRIDAYPGRSFTAQVQDIAKKPDFAAFQEGNGKAYTVELLIDGEHDGLRPGMSGEVAITAAERPNCLRVPLTAILTRGVEKYCYVQINKELQVRKVNLGQADSSNVEVIEGLQEGDSVLRSPLIVASRFRSLPKD